MPSPSAVINGASSHDDGYHNRTLLHMWNSGVRGRLKEIQEDVREHPERRQQH
jgi:hypothetical protein